jgi:hypothetical protein
VIRPIAVGLVAGLLVACVSAPRQSGPVAAGSGSVDGYAAAIKAASDRSDHESDSKARADLAADAARNAAACLALDPHAAPCLYGKALADGMLAHEHPTRAPGLLGSMLQNLDSADGVDPNYDKGGPSRVKALVLVRAPGWPLGPGDADSAVAAARRAVSLQADYPPNVLALAEALAKTGDAGGAHDNYARARDLATALPPGAERDEWLHRADEGLQRK